MNNNSTLPLVSILTSCYNGARFIENYGKCLLAQTYRPLECIIVNDGSEDESGTLLEALAIQATEAGINTQIIHQENAGLALGISRAYEFSTGDFITCWDIDDIFFSHNISTLAKKLQKSTHNAILANGYYVDESNPENPTSTFKQKADKFNPDSAFEQLLSGIAWNWSGAYIVKSSVLETIYGKRMIPVPRLWKNSQNLQLLLPASVDGIEYCDEPLMKYVTRSTSISHIAQSYANNLKRIEAYEDIRFQLLDILTMLHEPYLSIVSTSFAKIKLDLAYKYNHKEAFCHWYEVLKKNRKLTSEDYLLKAHICEKNSFFVFCAKLLHKLNTLFSSK